MKERTAEPTGVRTWAVISTGVKGAKLGLILGITLAQLTGATGTVNQALGLILAVGYVGFVVGAIGEFMFIVALGRHSPVSGLDPVSQSDFANLPRR